MDEGDKFVVNNLGIVKFQAGCANAINNSASLRKRGDVFSNLVKRQLNVIAVTARELALGLVAKDNDRRSLLVTNELAAGKFGDA